MGRDSIARILRKVQESENLDTLALDFFMAEDVFKDRQMFYAVADFRTDVREAMQETSLLRYAQGLGYRVTHKGIEFAKKYR